MMIAVLGTLPFLATLWLLVVLGARVLEEKRRQDRRCPQGQAASSAGNAGPDRQDPDAAFAAGYARGAEVARRCLTLA